MKNITTEQIHVEGSISFFQIEDILINGAVNEHSSMIITGILKEEMVQELLDTPLKDGMLSVCIKEQ